MRTRLATAAALTLAATTITAAAPATAAPATPTVRATCTGAGKVCWQSHSQHPELAGCKDLQWQQIKNARGYYPGHRVTATGCHPARDGYGYESTVTVWR